ncbi:MAG: hypothetical protein O2971_08525 [Proteobacteria bacterium]|nr:hypothetical protein [Pseudomonadota bacterium]
MSYFKSKMAHAEKRKLQIGSRNAPASIAGFKHSKIAWRILNLIFLLSVLAAGVVLFVPGDLVEKWLMLGYTGVVAAGIEYGFDIFVLACMPLLHFLACWIKR